MEKGITVEKVFIGGMLAIFMLAFLSQIVLASTPQLQYTCPICGDKFASYAELYQHFTTEHPSSPIEIIWQ